MDLKEFVQKLFLLYTNSWNDTNEFIKKRQYIVALDNNKIDFDLLMDRIAKYHKSEFIPTPAWLKEEAIHCYSREFKKNTSNWIQVKVYNPIAKTTSSKDAFPIGTTEEQMIKAYEKESKHKGWKILEVF